MCGGSAEEITKAFGVGFIAGLGAGALVCGLVMINVLAIAEAGAFLAAAAFGASLANVVLLSVLTVYSVASGNEQKLMTYVSLLSTALMGLCVTYGAYGEVTVSGDKGSKTISTEDVSKGNGVGNPVKIEGRGSTGRTISNTLNEQMAMHQVQSNPLEGAIDMSQLSKPIIMTDPRWPAAEGWVKMGNNVNGIEIHFVYNKNTNAFDDFKFK